MLFVAAGLVRSIFESAATGVWLLEDEDHVNLFCADFLHNYGQLVQSRPEFYGDEGWQTLLDDAPFSVHKMPPLDNRLTPELEEHYVWYRDLCSRDHCSVSSICQTMDVIEGKRYVRDTPPGWGVEQKHLGYAAMMTLHLATKVAIDCGFEGKDELATLGPRINWLMQQWGPASGAPRDGMQH